MKIQIRTDANAVLAERDIPNAVAPRLQAVFGGNTNAETALVMLDWMLQLARDTVITAQRQAAADAEAALEETAIRSEWS